MKALECLLVEIWPGFGPAPDWYVPDLEDTDTHDDMSITKQAHLFDRGPHAASTTAEATASM